jgi:AraC-like DNA-binding protein
MREQVRAASLTGYFEAMASLGTDPRPLLAEQGLSADLFINSEQPISAYAALRLLERSAAVTGCPTLGLRMAVGRGLANLGATGLLIAHQPTLRAALESLREFRSLINSTLSLQIEELGEEAILREDFLLSRPEPWRQSSDLALGVLARLCAAALGEAWHPRLVCFTHEAPPPAELAIHAQIFGCRAQFDSAFNGIVIAAADLDRPNAKADPQLALQARQLLSALHHPAARTRTEDAEQLIRLLLPTGRATIQVCAASLGLTVRTLQRALDLEGTSFRSLLDGARMQLSAQYLANPRMRITDVADLLGYASLGAFTRWHTGAFGAPPREMRGKR